MSSTYGPRWTTYGEVYAYRTRKPGAVLGLPILGHHWGYVGQTRNPTARHLEHTAGGGRYGKPAAPWSDLEPRRYVLWRMRRCPQGLLNLMEWLFIQLLQPVYNDLGNRANLRRISRKTAQRQRMARRRFGWCWNFTLAHVLMLLVSVVAVGLVVT